LATVHGRFTQRTSRSDEPAGEVRVLTARFALAFPDQYDVVYTKPGDEEWRQRFCSDGQRRWEIQQQFALDQPDVKKAEVGKDDTEPRRLIACFRLDLAALRADFAVTVEPVVADGKPAGARLVLTPARPAIAEQVSSLVIELGGDLRISRLTFDDPQGNRYQVTIDEAVYGEPIPAEMFRYDKPGE
jgi:outer membrane lipoprotein-sorting protein